MIVCCLIFVDLIVMFSSSKDTWYPFLQLDSLAQQIRISGPPLEQGVQASSASMTIYLSQSVTGGATFCVSSTLGWVWGWGGDKPSGDGRLEAN